MDSEDEMQKALDKAKADEENRLNELLETPIEFDFYNALARLLNLADAMGEEVDFKEEGNRLFLAGNHGLVEWKKDENGIGRWNADVTEYVGATDADTD